MKCMPYCSDTGYRRYGEISVSLSKEQLKPHYVIREFMVEKVGVMFGDITIIHISYY